MDAFIKSLYVLELICFSGGVLFDGTYPRTCLVAFLLTAIIVSKGFVTVSKPDKYVCLSLVIWIFLVQFVLAHDKFDNKFLSYIIYMVGALGLTSFSFNEFRYKLLDWMRIIAVVSIVFQIGYDFFNFPFYYLDSGTSFFTMSFLFNVAWGGSTGLMHRLSSIFWEPGQYQILIFFTLCLFIKEYSDFSKTGKWFWQFGVLTIALVMSQSTMGYLVFTLYLFTVFGLVKRSKSIRKGNVLKSITIIVCVCLGVYMLWNSSVVQDKLAQSDETQYDTSYSIRAADNLACLNAAIESPIYGHGVSTNYLKKRLMSLGSKTSSNGWLLGAASLGFTYIALLLFFMYRRISEMKIGAPVLAIIGILFISQCNESVIYYPYLYIYIYHFKYMSWKIL